MQNAQSEQLTFRLYCLSILYNVFTDLTRLIQRFCPVQLTQANFMGRFSRKLYFSHQSNRVYFEVDVSKDSSVKTVHKLEIVGAWGSNRLSNRLSGQLAVVKLIVQYDLYSLTGADEANVTRDASIDKFDVSNLSFDSTSNPLMILKKGRILR